LACVAAAAARFVSNPIEASAARIAAAARASLCARETEVVAAAPDHGVRLVDDRRRVRVRHHVGGIRCIVGRGCGVDRIFVHAVRRALACPFATRVFLEADIGGGKAPVFDA
jgi:hypothetical protein